MALVINIIVVILKSATVPSSKYKFINTIYFCVCCKLSNHCKFYFCEVFVESFPIENNFISEFYHLICDAVVVCYTVFDYSSSSYRWLSAEGKKKSFSDQAMFCAAKFLIDARSHDSILQILIDLFGGLSRILCGKRLTMSVFCPTLSVGPWITGQALSEILTLDTCFGNRVSTRR